VENIAPKGARTLTPEKLARFYKEVGGNLDGNALFIYFLSIFLPLWFRVFSRVVVIKVDGCEKELFLSTPVAKLSDIYSTLGCEHSLQPVTGDDFLPPSIPALTPRGFAIWQTIQLLLEPEEHVPYLQNAVKKFPLVDLETGERFPREIPRAAFPRWPDEETERWHDEAFARKAEENKKVGGAEKARTGVPDPAVATAPVEEESWRYRPRRKQRHRQQTEPAYEEPRYAEEAVYSRSAPGSGQERDRSRAGRHRRRQQQQQHVHSHSYSHPTYDTRMAETPVASDIDADAEGDVYASLAYGQRSSQHHPRPHHRHSASRLKHTSGEFAKSYIYANGDTVPVDPYPEDATYIRPTRAQGNLHHGYHSIPDLHYTAPTPAEPAEDELRSRFLRHRSSSPPSRAPLGSTSGSGRKGGSTSRSRGRRAYYDSEYESPYELSEEEFATPPAWDMARESAEAELELLEMEMEKRRKKEARESRRRVRKEQAHLQAQLERERAAEGGYVSAKKYSRSGVEGGYYS